MLKKYIKGRTYVFIDASNIIYGASHNGWRMDFEKLIKYLKTRYDANKVFYYAGLDPENKKQLGFYEKLQEFGYILRLVPLKVFSDGTRKGDVDSRMTFEIMKYFGTYNRAVILTGDGDYYWVLEYLIQNKKQVFIISFAKRTAPELKKLAKEDFAHLGNLRHQLQFRDQKKAVDSTNDSTAGIMDKEYHGNTRLSSARKQKTAPIARSVL